MSRLILALLFAAMAGAGCRSETPPPADLTAGERRLVDAYVRLSVLEALRPAHADSVDAVLDSLAAAWDTTGMFATMQALEADPFRWERIYDAITRELTELQRSPDHYWQAIRRRQTYAPEHTMFPGDSANAAGTTTVSTPE